MLAKAQNILIITIKGFRDCRPALISSQLSRYPELAAKNFDTLVLPAPFEEHDRSLNALDLANMGDRAEGRAWLVKHLQDRGKKYDLVLLPPILGSHSNSKIRSLAKDALGCPFIEMLSIPPGVAGYRIRDAFVNTLVDMGVEFYDNATIVSAEVKDGKCEGVVVYSTGRETFQKAKAFVIATGGILSGGLLLSQGSAREAIFALDIPVPANVDEWSEPDVFGKHLVSSLGVSVNSDLRVKDGSLDNVFFAGRILGGYDQSAEKSGHGVAVATGREAGLQAAALAQKASGGDI